MKGYNESRNLILSCLETAHVAQINKEWQRAYNFLSLAANEVSHQFDCLKQAEVDENRNGRKS